MKILTVTIPCYNSQDYMKKCIESILPGGEDVEILIVDDGSSDKTAEIADRYAARYPTIVKAIHQENGGHGEAVNTGIRNAAGIYFKVVDSDDWVDSQILKEIVETLKELLKGPETVDMFISNFVYDKVGARRKKVMQYRSALPGLLLAGYEEYAQGPLHSHAFCYLPDESFAGMRSGAAKAHLLCGQSFCVPAAALCEEDVLPG